MMPLERMALPRGRSRAGAGEALRKRRVHPPVFPDKAVVAK